ncbi:MAG: phosphotransferase [Fibrobacter sp.]|nr:phosphotransferase [Fibrobacter sp.]
MNNENLQISQKIREFLFTHGYSENFVVTSIAGAGSGRQYFRIADGDRKSVLQVSACVNDDFKHFVEYSKTFRDFGLPVTRVYCVDEENCQILQEDLGKRNLLDEISPVNAEVRSGNERILYPEVIDVLVKWQEASQSVFSSHTELWIHRFDFAALKWETDYFTENYLKAYKGIQEIPQSVRNFYSLLAVSVDAQPKVLMHRDFQSQNIMVRPNSEIAFVDFQGARRGSAFYDIASLLWDPYVCLPLDMIKDFFEYWRMQNKRVQAYTLEDAWESFIHASLQRVMQAMGAYCFLSKVKGIQKFEQYIEPGKKQLRALFAEFKKIAKATEPEVFEFMEKALA